MFKTRSIVVWLLGAIFAGVALSYFFWPTLMVVAFFVLVIIFWCHPQRAFYLLVVYLPFQVALNLAPDIDLLSGRVLILLLFFVWLVKWLKSKRPLPLNNQLTLALILFFAISLISLLVAQNQIWGLRKILVFASIFPLFFLTNSLIEDADKSPHLMFTAGLSTQPLPAKGVDPTATSPVRNLLFLNGASCGVLKRCGDKFKRLLWIIVAASGLSALIALGQFLAQFVFSLEAVFNFWAQKIAPWFYGQTFAQSVVQNPSWLVEINSQPIMRAIGLFPDPHMLAFYLGMTLPLVLTLLIFSKSYKKILFSIYCLALTALLLTFSRGGYLGLVASILVMFLLSRQYLSLPTKMFFGSFFLVLMVFLLIVGLPIIGRFVSSFELTEGSTLGRLIIWQESWNVFKEHPLTGVGLGNYPLALSPNEVYRSAVTSHNLYLDILVEIGIFGLLAWLWLLGSAFKQLAAKIKAFSLPASPWALGLFGSLVYFSVHSFFETAIFNPTILAVLMMVLGMSAAVAKTSRGADYKFGTRNPKSEITAPSRTK